MCEDEQGVVNPEVPTALKTGIPLKQGIAGQGATVISGSITTCPHSRRMEGTERVVGVFDFGNTGAGNNSGFEAMCYINEKPYQGVDVNHKEVFFPEELYGKTFSLTFRLLSGFRGRRCAKGPKRNTKLHRQIWHVLDEKVDDFYYRGTLILDTLRNLDDGNPVKYDFRIALDEACHCIDWSYPGSDAFYETMHQADDVLNEKIEEWTKILQSM